MLNNLICTQTGIEITYQCHLKIFELGHEELFQ